jgi:N-acetylglucosaminyl-diphospho-decaprenol L-rhamnosyltransferase
MPRVSAVVASFNSRAHLERCLTSVSGAVAELVVVDSASTDGSAALVRRRFPAVAVVELDENGGFGTAMNVGIDATSGDYVLLLNPDTWAAPGAVDALVAFAEADARVAVVGPRLRNPDGSLQRSVRGFPTPWRLATEYFFLRRLAPSSRLLNAFYGAGFDHRTPADAEFLVGAVLLVRREALADIGGFDTDFFMFNEEVDLSYRLARAGWRTRFCPDAEFVHVGGASTTPVWDVMYLEQLRSHLRFLTKHRSGAVAERMRHVLVWAMRLRAIVFRGERRRLSRTAAAWLASGPAHVLVSHGPPSGEHEQRASAPPTSPATLEPGRAGNEPTDGVAEEGTP